jgi:hypothetical protein
MTRHCEPAVDCPGEDEINDTEAESNATIF